MFSKPKTTFHRWLDHFFREHRLPKNRKSDYRFVPFDEYRIFENKFERFCVFEDQWINNPRAVKSKIVSDFGLSRRVFARKCEIKALSPAHARSFFTQHHALGHARSQTYTALYYRDEMVAAASFAAPKEFPDRRSAEMTRFCNKSYVSVTGGLSKLIKNHARKFKPDDIMTYADLDRGSGIAFEKIGFRPREKKNGITFMCDKQTGRRIPLKHFSDHKNRSRYAKLTNSGSMKYVLSLKPNSRK